MEKKNSNNVDSEKRTERLILAINAICAIIMIALSLINRWGTLIIQMIVTTTLLSWWMHIKNYKDYKSRAYITSCIAWINFVLYGMYADNFVALLPIMCVLTVILGIYGLPKTVGISSIFSIFLMLYHIFIKNVEISTADGGLIMFAQMVGILIIEAIIYGLLNTQSKNKQELLEAIEALKKVEKSKDDFLANVSHELRTPINTVCGMSEMILRENISDKVRKDVLDIQTAGRNLLAVVSDVLDFSELDSGRMELIEDRYNITSTINDIMNMSIARKNNKNVELIVDCDANIPRSIIGDEQKIRRAVMNIVDNAIKFTNAGGIIITITYRKESYGINLCISVKDTGIGMSDENVEKLFTSFNQVDTKRNRQEGGIGLGLAITQAIIDKMGGFIIVRSKLGKGTEVQLVIPQKVADERAIVTVKKAKELYVAIYIDMEKYDFVSVREGYENCITHIVEQLKLPSKKCKNLPELKRRVDKENFTHVIISWDEYCEDQQYFEELSYRKKVILVHERQNQHTVVGQMYYIYKPFYVLSVASVLNGDAMLQGDNGTHYQKKGFTAPKANILVVDDNIMNLRVVEGLLKPYKIKVSVAGSGKEAIEKIESMDYDFVFMDHMMPEMDGVETLHKIRQKPGQYFKNVPIIALTANAIGGAREMFISEGFSDFVAKPIELSVLERVMLKFIPDNKVVKNNRTEFYENDNNLGLSQEVNDVRVDNMLLEQNNSQNGLSKENELKEVKQEDLSSLEGIDVKLGLTYAGGNMEDYLDIVRIYHSTGLTKNADIQNAYDAKDWKNYAIMTHSLKSMSMSIGAVELSEMAKGLEMAAKSQDEEYINIHHKNTIDKYTQTLEMIGNHKIIFSVGHNCDENNNQALQNSEADKKTEEAFEITAERLHQEIRQLEDRLDTFEYEGVQKVLNELFTYQYKGVRLEEFLKSVKEKADAFDFMGATEELESAKEKMR